MLGVDERGDAPHLLGFSDYVQGKGGLAGGFGTVDLGHPAPRYTAHPEGQVERQRTGGNRCDLAALSEVLP